MHHFQRVLEHAPFLIYELFLLNIGQQLIHLTKTSLQSGTKCLYGKIRPTKARSRVYENGIPVRWDNLFSYKQILIF